MQRKHFDAILAKALKHCELDARIYKGHSFRIEAATLATESSFSDAQLRTMGCWKSNTFLKNISVLRA